jgi:hypothetical protein
MYSSFLFLPIVRCFGDESGVIPQNENDEKMSITHLGGIIPVEHLAEFLLLLYLDSALPRTLSSVKSSTFLTHHFVWLLSA